MRFVLIAALAGLAACGDTPSEDAATVGPAEPTARIADRGPTPDVVPPEVAQPLLSGASVQTGTATSTATGTLTVTIAAVDPTKAFLLFSTRSSSADPDSSMVRGRIASATTLEFARNSNDAAAIEIRWYVVSYPSGIRVQRGEVTQSATTVNVTLPQALGSLSRAFVTYSKTPAATDTTHNATIPVLAALTTTTNLQLRTNTAATSHVIWWQVVEYLSAADINVQRGTTAITGTATSATVTLPAAVDLAKTFVLVSYRTAGTGNDLGRRMIRAQLASTTSITIDRAVGGTGDDLTEIAWEAVELRDGSTVQRGSAAFASGAATATATLTAVNLAKTVAFASAQGGAGQAMGRSPYVTSDVLGVASFTFALTATQLTAQRTSTVAAADAGWFVVQFGNASAVCGDGVREGSEICDGTPCCTATCTYTPAGAAHAACTDLTPTDCQVAACDGSGTCSQTYAAAADGGACGDGVCNQCSAGLCVNSTAGVAGPGCTAGATECSAADVCNGSGACVAGDTAAGTTCTDTTPTDCQIAQCNGSGTCNQTQSVAANGSACGDGVCDQCSAGACVATGSGVAGPGCNAAATECSGADTCNGAGACNTNHASTATACTDTAPADCQVARCDGGGACNQSGGNVANGSACGDGVCDQCSAGACVATATGVAGPGCTAGATECSAADVCNGAGACNAGDASAGTACTDTTPTDCRAAQCDGSGTCSQTAANVADGAGCGDGVCDQCSAGTCVATASGSAGPGCTAGATDCSAADTCNGLGACQPNHLGSGAVCTDTTTDCKDARCNGSGTCNQTAADEPDGMACPGGVCTAGTCEVLRTNGETCALGSQCASGHCVDGFCCNSACTSSCDTCASAFALGTCSPSLYLSPGDPSCAPYTCPGGATTTCGTSCLSNFDCASTAYCQSFACIAKLGAGATCSADQQCLSGSCADGVCCNTACGDACDACNLPGTVGLCTPRANGAAGSPACIPYLCDGGAATCPTSCAGDANCATGHYCSAGTCVPTQGIGATCSGANQCASGECVDGVCCNTACDGACDACNLAGSTGVCAPVADGTPGAPTCSPFLCDGTATNCPSTCATSDDCVLTSLCDLAVCLPPTGLADGAACASGAECLSTFCIDGVCCNAACGAPCDACDLPGSVGVCSAAGAGSLGEPACSPNRCGPAGSCAATCAADADCAPGFTCTDGICGVSFMLTQSWSEGQLLDPQNPSAKSLIHVETATEVRLHVIAAEPNVDVVFYDPADNEITYTSAPAGMAYSRWSTADEMLATQNVIDTPMSSPGYHVLLRVQDPTPGLWTVKTTALAPPAEPMAVRVFLDANGGPGLSLVTDKAAYDLGQPVKVFAHLRNAAAMPPSAITGATVTASYLQFTPSDGQTVQRVPDDPVRGSFPLRDDGGGGDAVSGDGVYTGVTTIPTAGSYMLSVEAYGVDPLGRAFQRGAGKDVVVR